MFFIRIEVTPAHEPVGEHGAGLFQGDVNVL